MAIPVIGGILVALKSTVIWFFARLLKDWLLKIISTVVSVAFMWGFHALVKASPGRALYIQKKIAETYFTPPEEWAGFVASYLEQMTGSRIDLADIIGKGAVPGNKAFIEAIGEKFLHPMLNLIMPDPRGEGGIRPEDGIGGAERFLGTNLQFQIGAWLLHLLGDMQSFGMFKSLKDLPNAISWAYGIGWLSWLVMGVPFRMGISDPLEEHYNILYRPEKLNVSQLTRAYIKGEIEAEEWHKEMDKLGFTDHRKGIIYRLTEKEYTDGDLRDLFLLGIIDQLDIEEEYVRRGYGPEKAQYLSHILVHDEEIKLVDSMAKEAIRALEDGELDEGTCRSYLEQAGKSDRAITLSLDLAEMKSKLRAKLSEGEIYTAVGKGIIAWKEARDMLEARGYSWSEAELKLKIHRPEKEWIT